MHIDENRALIHCRAKGSMVSIQQVPRFGGRSIVLLAMLILAGSEAARAELRFAPYVSAQYEYDSNVFEVSGKQEAIDQRGSDQQADNILRSAAGLDLGYTAGQQNIYLSGEGRRLSYDRFGALSHNETTLSGGFRGQFSSAGDGFLTYRQDRQTASFSDLDTAELSLQTERALDALLGLNLTPSWRLEMGGRAHQSKLPLADAPEFELRESSANLAIKYRGTARLAAGIYAEYLDGKYRGRLLGNEPFEETSLQLTLDYAVTGLSSLGLKAGASRRRDKREDDGNPDNGIEGDEVSGFTGNLAYNRVLSGKTSANLQVFRNIDSFEAGANALFETGVLGSLSWQPSPKLNFSARAGWTKSDFKDDTTPGSAADRQDDLLTASIESSYQVLQWLSLRSFFSRRDRDSNIADVRYIKNLAGLQLRASLGGEPNRSAAGF